jgi:PKD repeat protein
MKKLALLFLSFSFLTIQSCKKELETLGEPPTEADAAFTYTTSPESDNILIFKASNPEVIAKWNFGNNSLGEGVEARGIYPKAGTYNVTLTVFNKGGSASSSQQVIILEDDLSLLDDPIFNFLTGGIDLGSKTWVIDSNYSGHFGVGPNPSDAAFGDFPNYYEAGANEKTGAGMYDDKYIFTLDGFKFDMITHGDVYLNSEQAGNFAGSYEASVGDYTAPYDNQLNKTWNLTQDGDIILTLSSGTFIGYNTGINTYKIVSIDDNEMFIRQLDAANGDLAWYHRLVVEGYDSGGSGGGTDTTGNGGGGGGGNDSTAYVLPIDFENEDPVFNAFGNSTYAIIDNPDTSGINSSARVLETVHGNETWAGIFVDLQDKLDFSSETTITFKIWAPVTGTVRVKLEDQASSSTFVEKDVDVTVANQWVELSVDFTGELVAYDRLVMFPGWGVGDAETFYLDDLDQQ